MAQRAKALIPLRLGDVLSSLFDIYITWIIWLNSLVAERLSKCFMDSQITSIHHRGSEMYLRMEILSSTQLDSKALFISIFTIKLRLNHRGDIRDIHISGGLYFRE